MHLDIILISNTHYHFFLPLALLFFFFCVFDLRDASKSHNYWNHMLRLRGLFGLLIIVLCLNRHHNATVRHHARHHNASVTARRSIYEAGKSAFRWGSQHEELSMRQHLGSGISMKLIFELLPIFVVLTHHTTIQSIGKQTNHIMHALSCMAVRVTTLWAWYTTMCVKHAQWYFVNSVAISSNEIIIRRISIVAPVTCVHRAGLNIQSTNFKFSKTPTNYPNIEAQATVVRRQRDTTAIHNNTSILITSVLCESKAKWIVLVESIQQRYAGEE